MSGFINGQFSRVATKAIRDLLTEVIHERRTLVAYESPNRLVETLEAIHDVMGDRLVSVGRELTKMFEETRRGTVTDVLAHFRETEPRGEITLVIAGYIDTSPTWDEARAIAALHDHIADGLSKRDAVHAVTELSGWERRVVYDLSLSLS